MPLINNFLSTFKINYNKQQKSFDKKIIPQNYIHYNYNNININ
jgi:hypothetical protein